MASPVVADLPVDPVNGLPGPSGPSGPPSRPGSPQSVNSSFKRKRDASDDGSVQVNGADEDKPTTNGHQQFRDEKRLVRNFFHALQSYDTNPPILKRPLPDPSNAEEPQAKRQKADEGVVKAPSVEQKLAQDEYTFLDDLVKDVKQATQDRMTELRSADGADGAAKFDEEALAGLNRFLDKTLELHGREMSYPKAPKGSSKNSSRELDGSEAGHTVLTVWGNAPQGKHLFTSLPKRTLTPEHPEGVAKLPDLPLPTGVSTTIMVPSAMPEKSGRSLTLGELFPAPRNLPPLQPPKAPKSSTKSNVLGFYHPELAERSKYRVGSYSSEPISMGHWLDYANATPSSQIKTRQRERAQSLAGHKPSSTELEISEMEALFRGAFSSFAPSKDDTAAVVSSGQVARMWWQRFGQRNFQRMIEAEVPGDEADENSDVEIPVEIDEKEIERSLEEWDDNLLDPSLTLEDVLATKPDHDKDVDDTLQEISDLIETLSSYQRNRNLTLPTSQNRSSADPAKADMLNGSLAQQPSEEERETYQILKSQLAVIIQSLPPYAVARLNSDKLEELDVSTKVQVRSDEYKGVMEEDEAAARLRHHQAAMQAANTPRVAQRTPSVSSASGYGGQYGRPYVMQSQSPVPVPNHYPQTPVRPQMPTNYRTMSGPMAGVPPQQQRPPVGQPFRPNGYGYGPQPGQPPRPFNSGVPPYQSTPNQQRIASLPAYANVQPAGTPTQRFVPNYGGYPQQGTPQGMQPQQHHAPPQGGYAPYMNGNGVMPGRSMAPQVPGGYAQSPQPAPQQMPRPPFMKPGQPVGSPVGPPRYAPNYSHAHMPANPAPSHVGPGISQPSWQPQHVMSDQAQINQANALARAQMAAHVRGFGEKLTHQATHQQNYSQVSGLAGIGLGGHQQTYDPSKMAAARAGLRAGGMGPSSPSPRPPVAAVPSPGVNGIPQPPLQQVPATAPSPASVPGATPSPAPSAGLQAKPPS